MFYLFCKHVATLGSARNPLHNNYELTVLKRSMLQPLIS